MGIPVLEGSKRNGYNKSMNKEDLLTKAGDPRYISGIYNYCDRWCERCSFTSRCLTFAMEEADPPEPEERDITNQRFWQKMMESMEVTLSLIQDLAAEEGIDLDSIPMEDRDEHPKVFHLLIHLADRYGALVDEWLDQEGPRIERSAADSLETSPLRAVPRREERERNVSLEEALEVIGWYQVFFLPKLTRAIHSREEERTEAWDFPKDSEGSAKVALLGMDRSLSAWGEILALLGGQEEGILKIIKHLMQMRELTEKEFPGARSFVRPGFDTQDGEGTE